MFEKNMNISFLADFYGEVLGEKPRELLELYYNEDLSLAEIADRTGLTRQGVRHVLKKAEEELTFLESKLGLANHFVRLEQLYDGIDADIKTAISLVQQNADPKEIVSLLEDADRKVQAQKQIGE